LTSTEIDDRVAGVFSRADSEEETVAFGTSKAATLFRVVAVAEALSWAALLVGMFFKYATDTTELGVKVFGPLHGIERNMVIAARLGVLNGIIRPNGPIGRSLLDHPHRILLPHVFRALFALRWKLGALLGWDQADSGIGERVRSLSERLPADLLEAPRGPDLRAVPGRTEVHGPPIFTSVYQTRDEWVAELANRTVHSLMHIGWVSDDSGGGYHAQMAVLTKPNGRFGKAYMAAIKPFRYALIYPMLLRSIERHWPMQAAR
jgi:hypothetical protein